MLCERYEQEETIELEKPNTESDPCDNVFGFDHSDFFAGYHSHNIVSWSSNKTMCHSMFITALRSLTSCIYFFSSADWTFQWHAHLCIPRNFTIEFNKNNWIKLQILFNLKNQTKIMKNFNKCLSYIKKRIDSVWYFWMYMKQCENRTLFIYLSKNV